MATKTKRRKVNLAKVKKLSTLLAIGLRDLRKQERAKNSKVAMGTWLKRNGKCEACMAGSVMRFSLGMRGRGSEIYPSACDEAVESRLVALNYLRVGEIGFAASDIGIASTLSDRPVAIYSIDRDGWWSDMKQLLADLKAAGE